MKNVKETTQAEQQSRCSVLVSNDLLCPAATYTHLDLFSGIGAFALAAHWNGWQTVAFCEKDEFCKKVLRKNFGQNIKIYDDITTFSAESFRGTNIVTAGFPCQDTSQANTAGIGLDGERSGLWKEAVRVIAEVQPDWVVLENVANYVRVDVDRLRGSLENKGYETTTFDFRACCVGLPTLERHIWVIAANTSERRQESTERLSPKFVEEKPILRSNSGNGQRRTICESAFRGIRQRISERLDKFELAGIRAIGNAVNPQIVAQIFSAIRDVEFQRTGT